MAAATVGATPAILLGAAPVRAHAFGARYDLPLPLDYWMIGAAAVVALSFAIMVFFFRARAPRIDRPRIDLLRFRLVRVLAHKTTTRMLQAASVGLFLLVLATGFFGVQETLRNFGPTFVWIVWWVGFAYVASLVANLWPVINPWTILFDWAAWMLRRVAPRTRSAPPLAFPPWLGVWPAVVLFGLFAWFELISEAAVVPERLAILVSIYTGLTWAGMAAFGRDIWLANGDPFSLAFSVLGRFAPLGPRDENITGKQNRGWSLRPYAGGLVVDKPCHPSMTIFVILMLSTVTFDGFKETPLWFVLLEQVVSWPYLHLLVRNIHALGFDVFDLVKTIALVLFPLLFFVIYRGFSWLAKDVSDSPRPVTEIAGLFVFSLVPIAIAYHLAHYLSYLLIAGQYIIPLVSDPFGVGWDLFGTAGYAPRIGVVGAKFVWYFAVIAIVAGHVFAVGVAHFTALNVFDNTSAALRSQYPYLFLMVAYTMVSLWILSQPIIETPGVKSTSEPSGTVSLAPFEFHEYCLPLAAREDVRYEFRSSDPITFNIHYHAGLTVRYPVRSSGVTGLAETFSAPAVQTYCLMWTNENAAVAVLTYRVTGP
jgi:hypothetical protein